MEEIIKKTIDSDGNKSVLYRKEWEKDGITYSKEVKQVEGGYIVRESKYGKPKNDPDADYISETKESVCTENPFKKKEDDSDKMFSFVDSLF